MSERRKIEDEAEAVRCLAAAEQAGLSRRVWARANGICGRSLRAWQMNIARRSAPIRRQQQRKPQPLPAGHALVELVPTSAPTAANVGAARYVLETCGARLEFGDDASVATLRRVLEALRSC